MNRLLNSVISHFNVPNYSPSALSTTSAPTEWWKNVSSLANVTYIPTAYKPSESANYNHRIFYHWRESTFDPSGGEWQLHIEYIVGGLLLIGFLFFFINPIIYYCCVGNKICCQDTKRKEPGGAGTNLFFWLTWALAAIGAAVAFYGFVNFYKEGNSVANDIGDLSTYLSEINKIPTSIITDTTDFVDVTSVAINNVQTCITNSGSSSVAINSTDSLSSISDLIDQFSSLTMSTEIEDAATLAGVIAFDAKETKEVRFSGIILFGILAGISLLGLATLTILVLNTDYNFNDPTWLMSLVRFLTLFAGSVLLIASWVTFSMIVGTSMTSGDFCQDPLGNTLSLSSGNTMVEYYLTCAGDNTAFSAISNGQAKLVEAMDTIVSELELASKNDIGCNTVVSEETDNVSNSGYEIILALESAASVVECKTINEIYANAVYQNFCDDFNSAETFVFRGLFILTLSLLACVFVWKVLISQADTEAERLCSKRDIFA